MFQPVQDGVGKYSSKNGTKKGGLAAFSRAERPCLLEDSQLSAFTSLSLPPPPHSSSPSSPGSDSQLRPSLSSLSHPKKRLSTYGNGSSLPTSIFPLSTMLSPPPTPSTLSPSPLLDEIPRTGPLTTSKISSLISPPDSPSSLVPSPTRALFPDPPANAFHRRTSIPPSPSQSTSSLSSEAGGTPSIRQHVGSKFSSGGSNGSTAPTSVHHFSTIEALGSSTKFNVMDDSDVVLSMDLCRFHAGDRLPVDPFWRPRWEMANIHVALWNGLDQVYRHAPFVVGPEERLAFSQFASALIHAIDTHHDLEEEYYFPSLEVAISMQTNLEGHASFDDGVRALKFYLRACLVDPSIYDAQTILDIIDLFAVHLALHFADELNTLDPDILREHFSTKDLDKQGASLQKHIIKDYKRHLYTALPVLIINTPPGREWPLLSPLVRRILIPLVLGRKYKSSWRYGKWPNQLKVFGSGGSKPAPLSKSLKTLPEVPEGKELVARARTQSSAQGEGEAEVKAGRRMSIVGSSSSSRG